jgi:hypothetical protein
VSENQKITAPVAKNRVRCLSAIALCDVEAMVILIRFDVLKFGT